MEGMVKNLGKFGGDIIKFVGDAMIVVWPTRRASERSNTINFKFLEPEEGGSESLLTMARKAIQCALEIQNDMNNKLIMRNMSKLSVKVCALHNFLLNLYLDWYWVRGMRTTSCWWNSVKSRILYDRRRAYRCTLM
jgi:hypothetical protein